VNIRVLFLGEGTSDQGLAEHVERLANGHGFDVTMTAPDLGRLPSPPGHSVEAKLRAVFDIGGDYDLAVIHRDADAAGWEARQQEVSSAVQKCMPSLVHVAVVPVRMTEAWLLLDETALRTVAGNPNGKVPLQLPSPQTVEGVVDPKTRLAQVLAEASELTGRRLQTFKNRFPQHRRQLLERLDPVGPVSAVPAWNRFVQDSIEAFRQCETVGDR